MPADGFFRPGRGGVDLYIRLTPKSADDAVEGIGIAADGSHHLKARIRAVPEKGAANAALEKLIAKWLGLPKRDVVLVSGGTSRLKTLHVSGDVQELAGRITNLVGG